MQITFKNEDEKERFLYEIDSHDVHVSNIIDGDYCNGECKESCRDCWEEYVEMKVVSNETLIEGMKSVGEYPKEGSEKSREPVEPKKIDASYTISSDGGDIHIIAEGYVTKKLLDAHVIKQPNDSIETTLNQLIDMLQNKVATTKSDDDAINIYIGMISGLCGGYLQYK